jgi:hypothetical protein
MAFADWIPTIINVGSSLFGGGGSSAPSAPSSSGLDWGSILEGVGKLASRVEMVPGAGALDEDIRKANRFNLLAGLLGGAGQIAGSQLQASEKRGLGQDLAAILGGKGTYTGESIKKGEYPESLLGKTLEDGIVPPPAPQSKSAALFGLMNKYPSQASQILELGTKMQTTEAESAKAQREQGRTALTDVGGLFTNKEIGNVPPAVAMEYMKRAGIPASGVEDILSNVRSQQEEERRLRAEADRAEIEQRKKAGVLSEERTKTEQQTRGPRLQNIEAGTERQRASAASLLGSQQTSALKNSFDAINTRLGRVMEDYNQLRDMPINGLSPEQLGQLTATRESSLAEIADLSEKQASVMNELSRRGQSGLSFGQPTPTATQAPSALDGLIRPTSRQEMVSGLQQAGVPNAEQLVQQYVPQESDVTMPKMEVVGKTGPMPFDAKSRVAAEMAGTQFEQQQEAAKLNREIKDKADSLWYEQTGETFKGNTKQLASLRAAAADLTRTTDGIPTKEFPNGKPLTPQQRFINQIVGIKSFVQGIDNSVVYPQELESAIAQSSSNFQGLQRSLMSWADNPQALTDESINGFLSVINGRIKALEDVDTKLNQGQQLFREEYKSGKAKPARMYITRLDERREQSTVSQDLKDKIFGIGTAGAGQQSNNQFIARTSDGRKVLRMVTR